jgi:hypothetical protein
LATHAIKALTNSISLNRTPTRLRTGESLSQIHLISFTSQFFHITYCLQIPPKKSAGEDFVPDDNASDAAAGSSSSSGFISDDDDDGPKKKKPTVKTVPPAKAAQKGGRTGLSRGTDRCL